MRLKNFILSKGLLFTLLFFSIFFSCIKDEPIDSTTQLQESKNNLPVGFSSRDLLSDNQYGSLLIEIDHMPNMKPNDSSVDSFRVFLTKLLNKDRIIIKQREIPTGGKNNYSLFDIKQLEVTHRNHFTKGDTIASYFIFVDGGFSGNNNVLGAAYRNTSMCVFEETVQANSGGFFQPAQTTLETTVINHEFGHIMGLVNIGSPMQTDHQDEDNGAHCDEENCLMYFQAETTDILSLLTGNTIPKLDSQCRDDLTANGGK